MIDPRTQYILYKERETALMAQIERNLKAQSKPAQSRRSADAARQSLSFAWIIALVQGILYRI